jgi:GntR family transcriptional regulator
VDKTDLEMSDWRFDPLSSEPLHLQFEKQLKQRISHGVWPLGSKIPSERELVQWTGLSRATIRQALSSLVHQNILTKTHGSGTYVARLKYEQPMRVVYSFFEQFQQLGYTLHDTVLQQTVANVDAVRAERLGVYPGTEVIVIERLRALEGQPLMVNTAYIPLAYCPDLASEPFAGSLYRLLAERYHLTITRATDKLEAVSASKRLAALLGMHAGAPLMLVQRTGYTTGDQLLHLGESYIRGNMCRFSIDLQSGQPATLELKADPNAPSSLHPPSIPPR